MTDSNATDNDIRSLLEASFDEEPKTEAATEAVSAEVVPEPVEQAEKVEAVASEPTEQTKIDEPENKATEEAPHEDSPKREPKALGEKAPQSWKPALREKWSSLPDDVKQEIDRRERDIQQTLQTSAAERKAASELTSVITPYEAQIRAEGSTPVVAVQSLLNSAYVLRTGAPAARAQMVAQIINAYGVDPNLVGQALSGSAPQVDPHTAAMQQELAQLRQQVTQVAQAPQVQQQQAIEKQINDFTSDSKNEFVSDVMPHMVALLNAGAASNLQDAYDQACYANPEVRKILQDRQVKVSSKKAASASVSGSPRSSLQPVKNGPAPSIREALEAAIVDPTNRI